MFKKSQPRPLARSPPPDPTSRDIYGFAVRPQHADKYKQYGPIYQEEERERAERWEHFLQRAYPAPTPAQPSNAEEAAGEQSADSSGEEAEVVLGEHRRSGSLSVSGSEGGSRDWTQAVQREWPSALRMSLWPVERVVDLRDSRRARSAARQGSADAATASEAQEGPAQGQDDRTQPTAQAGGPAERRAGPAEAEEASGTEERCEWEDELRALVRGGVPMYLRGELWQLFAGAKKRQVPGHYQALLLLLADGGGSGDGVGGLVQPAKQDPHSPYRSTPRDDSVMEKWTTQIEKDLPRTFPGHPVLDGGGRDALRRLLTAFARHNPDVGYCQGMNFLAALLLLLMPEEAAFWTLTALVDDLLAGYYSHNMIESQVDQLVLDDLVRLRFPTVVAHLDQLGVQVPWVSAPWFLAVFVNVLPWESVLRVWDVLLFEDNRTMLFRTALALIDMNAPALAGVKDAGDAVSLLQSLAAGTFDASALVLTACMGHAHVDPAQLQAAARQHRPQVVAAAQQRQAEREAMARASAAPRVDVQEGSPSGRGASTSGGGEATPGSLARGMSKLWRTRTDAPAGSPGAAPRSPEHAEAQTDERGSEMDDLHAQVAWLKAELCTALEAERAASVRADELELALVQLADKGAADETRRGLQAQVEQLTAAVEALQGELAGAQAAAREREAQAAQMVTVLAKLDTEHRETEEARVQAEADVVRLRHTQQALEAQVGILRAELASAQERARLAENMLEAVQQSALDGRPSHPSPVANGGIGHAASSPSVLGSEGTPKTLQRFGLSMRWLSDKKVGASKASDVESHHGAESASASPTAVKDKVADFTQVASQRNDKLEIVPL